MLSAPERAAALRRMAADGLDVLVVGGGITGAGVALEATARGYRIGLIDKADFASGTSSNPTKLVHGGIRYPPQFDFALVYEALQERGRLARNAPHLVKPLGFVLPYYKENKRPLGTPIVPPGGIGMGQLLNLGLWVMTCSPASSGSATTNTSAARARSSSRHRSSTRASRMASGRRRPDR